MIDASVDDILAKFAEGAQEGDSSLDKVLALKRLDIEARERAEATAREDRRRDADEARRSDMMKMLIGLGTTILPALLNKGPDPLVATLLQATIAKSGSGADEFRNMMEMQRQQSAAAMDSLKTALLGVMTVKDELHKQTIGELIDKLDNAGEGDSGGGVAGTLREIRLALGAVAGISGASPARADNPAIAAPSESVAENPGAQGRPAGQPAPPARRPVEVVLYQLMALQQGKVAKPKLARAAMGTVALQDEELTKLLLSEEPDAMARLMDYCQPAVVKDQALLQWITSDGVAEWVEAYVRDQLCPLIDELAGEADAETDEEGEEDGQEPETLTPASIGGAGKPAQGG